MTVFLARIGEVAAKVETTKGTFNAPATDGSESKLLLHNVTLESNFQIEGRPITHTDLSTFPALVGKAPMMLRAQMELRRTNSGTTADKWMELFQAGGWVITNPSSNTVLKPSSKHSDHKNLSIYAYEGSSGTATIRWALRGCAVKIGDITGVVGRAVMVDVEIHGVYNGITTGGAVNSVTHESAKPPTFLSAAFTYNAVAAKISRFVCNLNTDVQERESVSSSEGIEHFVVVDRAPTFEMDPEAEPTGTQTYIADEINGVERAIAFDVGSTISVAIPKAQITRHVHGVRNGLRTWELSGQMNRDSGDDEIVITCD